MLEFSLENISEKIHYGKTKHYFQEVLSSYHNGNYRSAVVMLWSVAVCDLVYKLQNLIDLYNDGVAKEILDEITSMQKKDPTSASWELKLIEATHEKTNLLDSSEYENLRYVQKQRHLSAHPILNADRELHTPNKETVRALIRNTLEGLLVKPPFYTQKITEELLDDICESSPALNTREKVKKYVESRYLSRLKPEVEISIYRTLWKLVFKLENEDCNKNRKINFRVLQVISDRNFEKIIEKIAGERDYYSNIGYNGSPLDYLVLYLSKRFRIYELLNDDAKLKIQYCVQSSDVGKICGWFVKNSLECHYQDLLSWIEGDAHPNFEDGQLKFLLEICDTEEWQHRFCCLLSSYYGVSKDFDEADSRFQQAICPYLELFDKEAIVFLIDRIERKDQLYRRRASRTDHKSIKDKLFQLYGEEFDLEHYPNFKRSCL